MAVAKRQPNTALLYHTYICIMYKHMYVYTPKTMTKHLARRALEPCIKSEYQKPKQVESQSHKQCKSDATL